MLNEETPTGEVQGARLHLHTAQQEQADLCCWTSGVDLHLPCGEGLGGPAWAGCQVCALHAEGFFLNIVCFTAGKGQAGNVKCGNLVCVMTKLVLLMLLLEVFLNNEIPGR